MAITVAEIVAKIRAEGADSVVSDMEKAEKSTSSFGSGVSKMGKAITGAGKGLTLGLTLPIAGLGVAMVNSASDLNEATSAAITTYGAGSDQIIKYSKDSATAVGLSTQEYLQGATVLGVFGSAAGLTGNDLAKFGNDTLGAAADLASFYNAPVPEALAAIQAGLRGEFDPLERFGIMMNQAALEAYAMEKGIWDGSTAMTAQQKTLAAQGYILDHMGAASGDFAKTSAGLANQQRILTAELKNLSAEMGQVLLPIALKAITGFRGILAAISKLSPQAKKFVIIALGVAAALGPVMVVLGLIVSSAGAVIGAVTGIGAAFSLMLGPVGLVVLALAALAIAYKTNLFGFRDAVNSVVGKVVDGLKSLAEYFSPLISYFKDAATSGNTFTNSLEKVPEPLQNIATVIGAVIGGVSRFIQVLTGGGSLSEAWEQLTKKFTNGKFSDAIDGLKGQLSGLVDSLGSIAGNIADWAIDVGIPAIGGAVLDIAGDMWAWAVSKLPDLANLLGDIASWTIDVAVPEIGGLVADAAADMWAWAVGKLPALGSLLGDIASWSIDVGLPEVAGLVADAAADMWAWIKGKLPALGSLAGDIASWAIDIPIPDIGGAIKDFAGSLWGWIKSKISWLGGSESAEPATDDAAIGAFDVDVPMPGIAGAIMEFVGSVWDWVKSKVGWLTAAFDCILDPFDIDVSLPEIAGTIVDAYEGVCAWVLDKVAWLKNMASGDIDGPPINIGVPDLSGSDIATAFTSIWEAAQSVAKWLIPTYIKVIKLELRIWGKVLGTIIDQFPSMWEAAKSVALWLSETITQTVSVALDIASATVNVAQEVYDAFESAITSALSLVKDAGGWVWRNTVSAAVDVVKGGGGDEGAPTEMPVIDAASAQAAAAALEDANTRISAAIIGITSSLSYMGSVFSTTATNVSTSLTDMTTALSTFTSDVGTQATAAGNDFNTKFYDGLLAGQKTLDLVLAACGVALGNFVTNVGVLAKTAGDRFNTQIYIGLYAGQQTVDKVIAAIMTSVGKFVTNIGVFAKSAGDGFNTNIQGGLEDAESAVDETLSNIGTSLGGFVRTALSDGTSIGNAIGQGIYNGITAWTQSIANAAANAVNQAEAAARNASDSHSPSRKFIAIGEDMGEGGVIGIQRKINDLIAISATAADAAVDAFGRRTFGAIGGATYTGQAPLNTPLPVPSNRLASGSPGGGNTFVVMTRSELAKMFEAVDVVQVLTSPDEIKAAWGS